MNEVFFPQGENISRGMGSCYYINHNGAAKYHEVSDICLGSTSSGSLRGPLSLHDPESTFLKAAIDYLYVTNDTKQR